MNATIGIYDTHELAVEAVKELHDSGYPVSQLTIMGLQQTEDVDSQMNLTTHEPIKTAGASIGTGTVVGATIGILTGVGVFAIPGLGFLYGAGALIGAIAGFDFGLIGAGVASALAIAGVKDANAKKYHEALVAGKFLVIAHGDEGHVNQAKTMLTEHGTHNDLEVH